MTAPAFLAQVDTLSPGPLPRPAAGGGAAVPPSRSISATMEHQEEDMWCWASVTQCVERWRGATLDQSHVVSDHVSPGGGPLACISPLVTGDSGKRCIGCKAGCDGQHSLKLVLTERGRLAPGGASSGSVLFKSIVDAIDARRPLPVRIRWNESDGHFVCVVGYRGSADADGWVKVLDPLNGVDGGPVDEIELRYETFRDAYPSTGGATGTPNFRYEVVA